MVPLREKVESRAVKAGIRASVKQHHAVSREELLNLRLQILPTALRAGFALAGATMIAFAVIKWPFAGGALRGVEAVFGILLVVFGFIGVRRTLESILDSLDSYEAVDLILKLISEAISNIDL